jgi:hypothetical protein
VAAVRGVPAPKLAPEGRGVFVREHGSHCRRAAGDGLRGPAIQTSPQHGPEPAGWLLPAPTGPTLPGVCARGSPC